MSNAQQFQRKLAAAKELNLVVNETFTKIDGDYFQRFEIKKNNTVIESQTFPMEKRSMLENLAELKAQYENAVVEMQTKIDDINALD